MTMITCLILRIPGGTRPCPGSSIVIGLADVYPASRTVMTTPATTKTSRTPRRLPSTRDRSSRKVTGAPAGVRYARACREKAQALPGEYSGSRLPGEGRDGAWLEGQLGVGGGDRVPVVEHRDELASGPGFVLIG